MQAVELADEGPLPAPKSGPKVPRHQNTAPVARMPVCAAVSADPAPPSATAVPSKGSCPPDVEVRTLKLLRTEHDTVY